MPALVFSQALTANQQGFNPVSGWQYEYVPFMAALKLLIRSTTTGARLTVYSGSGTIQERSPIQGGGTAGVTPSDLNTPAVTWMSQPGDRIKLVVDETAGGTPTIDGVIVIEPL